MPQTSEESRIFTQTPELAYVTRQMTDSRRIERPIHQHTDLTEMRLCIAAREHMCAMAMHIRFIPGISCCTIKAACMKYSPPRKWRLALIVLEYPVCSLPGRSRDL